MLSQEEERIAIEKLVAAEPAKDSPKLEHDSIDRIARTAARLADGGGQGEWHSSRNLKIAASIVMTVVLATTLGLSISNGAKNRRLSIANNAPRILVGAEGSTSVAGNQSPKESILKIFFKDGGKLGVTRTSRPSYALTWKSDAFVAAAKLAKVFGVSTSKRVDYLGGTQFGSNSGPSVRVYRKDGLLRWAYVGSTTYGTVHPTPISTNSPKHNGASPSISQATNEAKRLVSSIGMSKHQGTPLATEVQGIVFVRIPLVIDGIVSTIESDVNYGPSNSLVSAGGFLADVVSDGVVHVMAPVEAVDVLRRTSFFLPNTDQNIPGKSILPTFVVTINQAKATYSIFQGINGVAWLLPSWILVGPQELSNGSERQIFSAIVDGVTPDELNVG